jgi:putative membrane protein
MDGWGWVPAVVGLVFLATFIGLLVWLVTSLARKPGMTALTESPTVGRATALLDERYAKGEIERDEYLQRKADLKA